MTPAERGPAEALGAPPAKWWGWGDPQKRTPLSDGGLAMLRAELGEHVAALVADEAVAVEALAALRADAVGGDHRHDVADRMADHRPAP